MNRIAAYGGFPVRYPSWRFGMDYERLDKGHQWGLSKIYELVVNTNPSYAFLMEQNDLLQNKVVVAHVLGHTDFFKNNVYFRHTSGNMIDKVSVNADPDTPLLDVRILSDTIHSHATTNPFLKKGPTACASTA